ncbi:MAG: phasin family protein [Erythrobacter sp.]
MADAATTSEKTQSNFDAAAEKAYADAAVKKADADKVADAIARDAPDAGVNEKAVEAAIEAPASKTAPTKAATAKKPAAKKAPPVKKATSRHKATTPSSAARKAKTTTSTPKTTAPAAKADANNLNSISKLKDTIMATTPKNDITQTAKKTAADMQDRMQNAYSKAGEFASEAGEFQKANAEAIVDSGKIFFTGAQELVRENVETGKTVVETMTEDAKKVAAIKSPTELMQLQGEIARRNFDAVVSYGSQRTEAWLKLYNDAFAPISNRMSVAGEKLGDMAA